MNEADITKKNTIQRKKVADLKAVSPIIDDETGEEAQIQEKKEPGAYSLSKLAPDEELIQTTARIKSERDLLRKRMEKMKQSREKVSATVFEKVYRDYSLQLESITHLLNEKKNELKKGLKSLYSFREKQQLEINRHREILEEAQFRHYLEEFSEEQYKEVEGYETREIQALSADLAKMNTYIRAHEELLDQEDLGFAPTIQPTKTGHPSAQTPLPPHQPIRSFEKAPSFAELRKSTPNDFSEKTPLPDITPTPMQFADSDLEELAPQTIPPGLLKSEEILAPSQEESNTQKSYFSAQEDSLTDLSPAPDKNPQTSIQKTVLRSETAAKPSESIMDVIEDIPLELESEEGLSPASLTPVPKGMVRDTTPTPQPTAPVTSLYKLAFKSSEDGTVLADFMLKENTSIGRSPSNDLVLQAPKISRQHAAINKYKDQYLIIDLKSSNGVFVNGRKIDEHALQEGDVVSLGGYQMIFSKS